MTFDPATPEGLVRLLINDTSASSVFEDAEITAFLTLEGSSVKLAAAQAMDVIADDEALIAKVISVEGASTNGPAVASALRERAKTLREQAAYDLSQSDDGGVFEIVMPVTYTCEW